MADTEQKTDEATGPNFLAVIDEHRPEIVLLDEKARDRLLDHIEKEIEAFQPDLSTAGGREEIKGFAFKITRTHTAANKARLAMTEEAREKIRLLNEAGKAVIEPLKELAKKARAPLTEWEDREKARQADCEATLERLRNAAVVPLGTDSGGIRARIAEVEAESMAEDRWQGMLPLAEKARETALDALRAALERVVREEEERAELARLRAEREERERADREREEAARREKEAAEAEERRQAEIEESRKREAERQAKEDEERKANAASAAQEAEARAREEERKAAEEAAAAKEAEHQRALAAEREARERLEAAEREREQQEKAEREARERLEADQAHRTMVKREAKEALMTVDGVTEKMAREIVVLIIAQEVPRCFLDFAAEPKVRKADPVEPKPEGALL